MSKYTPYESLLVNLRLISFFEDEDKCKINATYLKLSVNGTPVLQHGQQQIHWEKVMQALVVVDPNVVSTPERRKTQYADLIKYKKNTMRQQQPPSVIGRAEIVKMVFTQTQLDVINALIESHLAPLHKQIAELYNLVEQLQLQLRQAQQPVSLDAVLDETPLGDELFENMEWNTDL